MRKNALIVLCAAVVLALGITASAYANVTSTYQSWSSAEGSNSVTPTPHKGYTSTTVKCAVCHAVHKATNTSEILLRSTVGDACTFCHITTSAGVVQIYNATAANYGNVDNSFAHNTSGAGVLSATNVRCVDCHAVHGANTMGGNVTTKILKATGYQTTNGANVLVDAVGGSKQVQLTAFCTKCHPYFVSGYEQTVSESFGSTTYMSHIMTATPAAYANPHRNYSGQVAFAPSDTCRTCHDAGLVDQTGVVTSSYPHYTPGAERFLKRADNSSATATDSIDANYDGVCLKCHRNATVGVGTEF